MGSQGEHSRIKGARDDLQEINLPRKIFFFMRVEKFRVLDRGIAVTSSFGRFSIQAYPSRVVQIVEDNITYYMNLLAVI